MQLNFKFYFQMLAVGLWFLLCSLLLLTVLPFRWKDVSLGSWFAKILYWGSHRILAYQTIIQNREFLTNAQPCVYVANHQSNLDILTMAALYQKNTVVIGKKSLKWIPLFGWFFIGSGNILIDRKNRSDAIGGLNDALKQIKENQTSLWIFPEGTRNHGSTDLLPFKKGAFHIAIQAQIPIVPIVHEHLSHYYLPNPNRFFAKTIAVAVLNPISTRGKTLADLNEIKDLVYQQMNQKIKNLD